MTHIKYPNEMGRPVPSGPDWQKPLPHETNWQKPLPHEPNWQNEAMRLSALLHSAMMGSANAEARATQLEFERDALQAKLDAAADRVNKITLNDAGKLPPDTLGVWVLALETAHKAVLDELKVKE